MFEKDYPYRSKHMKALLIVNPVSGRMVITEYVNDIRSFLKKKGFSVRTFTTRSKDDARLFAEQYGGDAEMIVCCGGDGTLSEIVNGIVNLPNHPIIGYIPTGTTNDFAKNMRSAYRAAAPQERKLFNVGFRLARGEIGKGFATSQAVQKTSREGKKILIAYFTWSGNTQGIAYEIQKQTGAEIFEIQPEKSYSDDYNTVLRQAQRDQRTQARPKLKSRIKNFNDYDIIMLGYPNWWASIPMPIASFLQEYDFNGKIIMPFCSHGGGRFGQSLTAIAKLAPNAVITEGLSIHYSGGGMLKENVSKWLSENQ